MPACAVAALSLAVYSRTRNINAASTLERAAYEGKVICRLAGGSKQAVADADNMAFKKRMLSRCVCAKILYMVGYNLLAFGVLMV